MVLTTTIASENCPEYDEGTFTTIQLFPMAISILDMSRSYNIHYIYITVVGQYAYWNHL